MLNKNLKLFFWAFVVSLVILIILLLSKNISFFESGVGPSDMASFVECLDKKNIFVYGSLQDSNVRAQLSLFGNYSDKIKVIDCKANTSMCAEVVIFPTWNVNGVFIHGGLSLNVLSRFSGC